MISFRSQVGSLLFLVLIFLLNFLSRTILSPLMPTVEEELKIGHEEAGFLFFLISLGYCLMLLGSGLISSRFTHRRTIIFSSLAVGGALLIAGLSSNLWGIRFGFLLVGMAAGIYMPSGIATITGLVSSRDWGKAMGVHELAPNLSFMAAPLIAEVLLRTYSWQGVLIVIGIASMASSGIFACFGKGGDFRGEPPNARVIRSILTEPSFWIMIFFFALGVAGTLGVYSMIPLYLVSERGMDRTWVNTLFGLSRVLMIGGGLFAGWMTDRMGLKRTLKAVFLSTGLVTALLGMASDSWIIILIFIQPLLASCFFPAGFAALPRMGSARFKNVAVSFTIPFGYLLGGGAIPAGLGFIGEAGSFSLGFAILGSLFFGGFLMVRYLKLAPLESPHL
ncbi:MAG: nitrate/nitrite transporter [Thermodesulfobacteriota bacterium]